MISNPLTQGLFVFDIQNSSNPWQVKYDNIDYLVMV
jgi:hypothetical protein